MATAEPTKRIKVPMEKGPHSAEAELWLYERWVVHAVRRNGLPDMANDDESFETMEAALEDARCMWYATLP